MFHKSSRHRLAPVNTAAVLEAMREWPKDTPEPVSEIYEIDLRIKNLEFGGYRQPREVWNRVKHSDGYSIPSPLKDRGVFGRLERDAGLCAANHDVEYYYGGDADMRRDADAELRLCMANYDYPGWAEIFYWVLRVASGPWNIFLFAGQKPVGWGHGKPYPGSYEELTPKVRAALNALKKRHQVENTLWWHRKERLKREGQ